MGEKIPYRIGNDLFMIGEIQQMYPSPKYGFKEFASNAIDNRLENEALNLGILVSKTNNKIIFVDNGSGITYKTLKMIPFEVGESLKRGVQSAIGEKAFGMMGFPSCFATQCIVYSRRYDSKSDDFNYLRMNADLKAGAFRDIIKPKDVPMLRALPNFGHGTIVELTGIPVDKIEKYFTPGSIKEIISTTFSPLLRKGIISVKVGYLGRNQKKIPIDPVDYTKNSGVVKVLDDVFPVEIKTRKHTIKGEVELYLFVNPKGTGDKVGYYNKGVLVLDDIVDLDDLASAYVAIGYYGKNKADYYIGSGNPMKLSEYFSLFLEYKGNTFLSKKVTLHNKSDLYDCFSTKSLLRDTGFSIKKNFEQIATEICKS